MTPEQRNLNNNRDGFEREKKNSDYATLAKLVGSVFVSSVGEADEHSFIQLEQTAALGSAHL